MSKDLDLCGYMRRWQGEYHQCRMMWEFCSRAQNGDDHYHLCAKHLGLTLIEYPRTVWALKYLDCLEDDP